MCHVCVLLLGSFAIDNEQCDAPQTLPDDDGDPLQTVPDDDDDDASVCCQSPPVQVMERPAAAAAETSAYRIPSYVFATTKTSHPEWSTTSNESLFSIHTGNMSFTRDQFSWLLKSGELGIYGGPADIRKSGELPPPSPVHVRKSEEQQRGAVNIQTQERIPSSSRKTGEEIIAAHFKTLSTTSRTSYDKETDSQGTSSSQVSESADSQRTGSYQTSENTDSQGTSSYHTSESGDYQGRTSSSHVSETPDSEPGIKKDDPVVDRKQNAPSALEDRVPLTNCISHHSDASGQSFAFPV